MFYVLKDAMPININNNDKNSPNYRKIYFYRAVYEDLAYMLQHIMVQAGDPVSEVDFSVVGDLAGICRLPGIWNRKSGTYRNRRLGEDVTLWKVFQKKAGNAAARTKVVRISFLKNKELACIT